MKIFATLREKIISFHKKHKCNKKDSKRAIIKNKFYCMMTLQINFKHTFHLFHFNYLKKNEYCEH